MLKKILIVILVIVALFAVMASLKSKVLEDPMPDATTEEPSSVPVVLPGDMIVIDPEYSGEIVADYRDSGFDTITLSNGKLAIAIPTVPGETYDVVWYCEPSLAESISSYGGTYFFSRSPFKGESDSSNWLRFNNADKTGVVLTDSFVASEQTTELHVFDSDENTDIDMIYVDGGLLSNFKFVVLKRS